MTASSPLIGITVRVLTEQGEPRHCIRPYYAECVIAAGGTPLYLPPTTHPETIRRYVRALDGLLLSGGADIPPEAYGAPPEPETKPMPRERYEFERALIEQWLETPKPLLGICLGCQFANVAAGGTLIQHIPREVGGGVAHVREGDAWHPARVAPGSRLAEILSAPGDSEIQVNSYHHQAVGRPGAGFKPVAWAPDGVVEALESNDGTPRLLVQWHPERMPGTEIQRRLFAALVQACQTA